MGRPPFGGDGDRVRGGGRVRVVDTGAAHRGAALRSRRAISTIIITEKRRADPSVVGLAPMVNLAGAGTHRTEIICPGRTHCHASLHASGATILLETRNSKLETRNSKLETQNSKLETKKAPPPRRSA